MKRTAAAGLVLLVVLCLSGCSRWFVQHDVAEAPLREQIGELASVVEVASSVDAMFGASVDVGVSEVVAADIHAIVASADELLEGRDVHFSIVFDGRGVISVVYPLEFTRDQLASEVDYWLALSSANGAPLGMLLQDGPSRNIWDPDESDLVDWDALRAVPDPSTAEHSWYLDGMVVKDAMPTPEVVALGDRLAAIRVGARETLLLDYVAPGFATVRYTSPDAGLADPTAASSWPLVQQLVSEIGAVGLPQANLVFSTDEFERGASLHFGDCATVQVEEPTWASAELVDALTTADPQLVVGVSEGFCNDGY